jgi:hypothetical protein
VAENFGKVLRYKKFNNTCHRVITRINGQYWLPHARRDRQDLIPGAADRAAAPGKLHWGAARGRRASRRARGGACKKWGKPFFGFAAAMVPLQNLPLLT